MNNNTNIIPNYASKHISNSKIEIENESNQKDINSDENSSMESEQDDSDFSESDQKKHFHVKRGENSREHDISLSVTNRESKGTNSNPWKESPRVSNGYTKSNNLEENKIMKQNKSKTIDMKDRANSYEGSSVQNDEIYDSSNKLIKENKNEDNNNITSLDHYMNGWSFGQTWKGDQSELIWEKSRPAEFKIKVENRLIKIVKEDGLKDKKLLRPQIISDSFHEYNLK